MKAISPEENKPMRVGRAEIKVDGKLLAKDLDATLQNVEVEAEVNMPAMFSFRFSMGFSGGSDQSVREVDDKFFEKFTPGTPVEIKMGRGSEARVLISGHITALEPNFTLTPTVEVRGFDRMYHLRFGTFLRSFENTTDSDLAGQLIADTDLKLEAEATTTLYEYLLQNNQSNYDFLRERAERLGYEMRVEEKKFIFASPDETASPALTLTLGETLDEFSASMKIPTRGNQVEMRGMDLRDAAGVASTAPAASAPTSGKRKNGFGYAKSPFPASDIAVVDEPIEDALDAEALAEAKRDLQLRNFVTGEGRAPGQPKLMPGRLIKLEGLGPRFNGVYYVSAATHTLNEEGYKTTFKVRRRKI